MRATIDHLVYLCPHLGPAVEDIAAQTGVRPAFGGQHPGLGTHNALLSLASHTYLGSWTGAAAPRTGASSPGA